MAAGKKRWEQALQLPFPQVQKVMFQQGPHFVVGRNKILSHPKEFYEKLSAFSSGAEYPGSTLSTDNHGMANGNGHVAGGVFSLEGWWNLIFNEKDSWQHPQHASFLRCQLRWCNSSSTCWWMLMDGRCYNSVFLSEKGLSQREMPLAMCDPTHSPCGCFGWAKKRAVSKGWRAKHGVDEWSVWAKVGQKKNLVHHSPKSFSLFNLHLALSISTEVQPSKHVNKGCNGH